MKNINLTHHFLIAMPDMVDPNFSGSLIYIVEHTDKGALGFVVNRKTELTIGDLFERIALPLEAEGFSHIPIGFGGPVQTERGFVLHRPAGQWQSSLKITDEMALTSSKDILEAVGSIGQPSDILLSLGYSGWDSGQLEAEMAQNAWLSVEADSEILFKLQPEERLPAALKLLGVDLNLISPVAGHA